MVASHLAAGSILDKVTHPSVWVDGASGFVLFSGLLIGIVQRSTRERRGTVAGVRKLAKRIGIVYLGHIWLCLLAFAVVEVVPSRDDILPSISDQGGASSALLHMLTLQINPYFASILSMYVVLMICTFVSLWLLERNRLGVLLGWVAALIVFGTIFPTWTALPRESGVPGPITLATWFGLMTIGVIAGWYWRTPAVQSLIASRTWTIIATGIALSGVSAARVLNAFDSELEVPALHALFTKDGMGLGRIVVSLCSYFALYRALTWLLARPRWVKLLSPINLVGKRSLDSYLILSSVVLVLPAIWEWESKSLTGILLALAVLTLCIWWAFIRPAQFSHKFPGARSSLTQAAHKV